MKRLLHTKVYLIGIAVMLAFSGCATKLDPAGPYQGDTWLYNIDSVSIAAYKGLDAVCRWEMNNRAQIQQSWPGITKAVDSIRDGAPGWWAEEQAARLAYVTAKSMITGTNTPAANVPPPDLTAVKSKLFSAASVLQTQNNSIAGTVNSTSGLPNPPKLKTVAAPTLN